MSGGQGMLVVLGCNVCYVGIWVWGRLGVVCARMGDCGYSGDTCFDNRGRLGVGGGGSQRLLV